MVGYLLRHSKWFSILTRGAVGGKEYTDGVNKGRKYVEMKRLSTERKNLQLTNGYGEEEREGQPTLLAAYIK